MYLTNLGRPFLKVPSSCIILGAQYFKGRCCAIVVIQFILWQQLVTKAKAVIVC